MKPAAKQLKPRSDAWDADLDEARRWQAYAQFRRCPWYDVSAWVDAELGLPPPSRSALYRWAARMRKLESAHRLEQAITAREEIGTLASTVATDAKLVDAYKTLAADLALKGNASDAVKFTVMAMQIGEGQRKGAELALKARAQETKDAALRLAREKFEAAEERLANAKDIVTDAKLTDAERTAKIKEIFGL